MKRCPECDFEIHPDGYGITPDICRWCRLAGDLTKPLPDALVEVLDSLARRDVDFETAVGLVEWWNEEAK